SYDNGARSWHWPHIVKRRWRHLAAGAGSEDCQTAAEGCQGERLAILAALEEIYMNQNLDIGTLPESCQGCQRLSVALLGVLFVAGGLHAAGPRRCDVDCMSSEHFGPRAGNLREYLAHLV